MNNRSTLGPRVLLACLVLVAFAVPAEWATRRWLVRPQELWLTPGFGTRVRPGTRVVQSREGWGAYTANTWGLLGAEPATSPGTLSGLLLGDSFAQGLEVRFGERFSERAEQDLPGLSLLNAAAAGRSPIHYALALPGFERALHPRFVVVQVNDADLSEMEDPAVTRRAREEFQGVPPPAASATVARRGLRGALRRSSLMVFLQGRVRLLWGQERERLGRTLSGRPPEPGDVVARPYTPRAAAIMDSLFTVMQAVTPRLVLVYIPHINYFSSPPAVAYPTRRAFYRELAARHHLPLVDPSDELLAAYRRDGEPLHGFANTRPGYGHMNARGHAVVGRLLAAEIAREFRPRAAPPAESGAPGGTVVGAGRRGSGPLGAAGSR